MSLAQHVTQGEGFDYQWPEPDESEDQERGPQDEHQPLLPGEEKPAEWRRMSFAPVDFTPEVQQHSAAYRVSNARRGCQVATAVLTCWLASGIVFGFAALKPVFIAEGVFHEYCDEAKFDPASIAKNYIPCPAQDMRLNLIFITASITTNIACLPAGACLDRFGRRFTWIIGCIFLAAGSLLMGMSFSIGKFNGYLAGNMFLGLGGTFLFVPSFQLSDAFPKYSGLVVAIITGSFDASASVFLFYRLAYESSDGTFSPDKFFLGYLVVPVMILLAEFCIMPSQPYHTMAQLEAKIEKVQDRAEDTHASDGEISDRNELARVRSARSDRRHMKLHQLEEITGDAEQREERVKIEEGRQEASGVWGVLHGVPAHRQMRTSWFILILLLTALQMLRMNYFIATIRSQYRYMLGSDSKSQTINHFFDAALPIGGVLSTPLIGLLLNNLSMATSFGVLTVFIVALGVLNCIHTLWAGYATVVTFVIFRPLYYSAISDYATKVFGFATFGRIYGALICFSGLVNFAQSGLDALTQGPLQGDPTLINSASSVAGTIIGIALIFKTSSGLWI